MRIIPEKLVISLISFSIISCSPIETLAAEIIPFRPGEKMVFQVRWAFIVAGEAVIEVLPVETFNGKDSYHFVFRARTSPFVDLFYKVRDRVDSYTDINMNHSLYYKKKHQGHSHEEASVEFDWEKGRAQYSEGGQAREPIAIMPGTFDPLSVFYAFRIHAVNNQFEIFIPVTDGKKCVMGKARVIGRERIKVGVISYDTFVVEPEIEHIGGVFEKSEDARLQIWVTADDQCIPVRIKSKVIVGSFVADLVSFEQDSIPEDK
jgi:hypothetical protein